MISIITATVGRPSLFRVIQNVQDQTFPDWEHVVVADGIDLTEEQLIGVEGDSRRTIVQIQKSKNDHGKTPQNVGIVASSGEFVTLLDDDNEWLPDHLTYMMKPFEDPTVQIVFCPLTMIHFNNENYREERNFSISQGKVDAGNWIARREMFHRHGLFWAPNRRSYDWELLKKMFQANEKYVVIEQRNFLYYTPKP